jgi:uncharacterized membrane protein
MEKLKLLDTSLNMDKMARAQSLVAGASFLFSGIKHMKESPKMSIAKSVLGGYLVYRALSGHCHMNQVLERNTAAKA